MTSKRSVEPCRFSPKGDRFSRVIFIKSSVALCLCERIFVSFPPRRARECVSDVVVPLRREVVRERRCRFCGAVLFFCFPQASLALLASHGVINVKPLRGFEFPEKTRPNKKHEPPINTESPCRPRIPSPIARVIRD